MDLVGGSSGNNWGWIVAEQARINGYALVYGDLTVTGNKNFVQPHPTDSTKAIRYIAIEAGEALTLARGLAHTDGGIAKVDLPEDFSLVTSDKAPLTVLLTVESVPVLVFVKSKSKESITVELKGSDLRDYGDVEFAYQVTGVRDGFENQNPIVPLEDVALPKTATKEGPEQKRMKDFADRIQKIVAKAKGKK
jgi:hypothetical protein